MATVTLPGGAKAVNITTGTDDQKVLQTAIKNLFNAAAPNITADTVASGKNGSPGLFNLVLQQGSTKVTASAGTNVQAIIDIGTGADTLTGGAQTTVLVGNAKGDAFNTANNNVTVFGGAGNDTVNVSGSAVAYLEGGKNQVNLNGGDSISLASTVAGSDTVNISAGNNTVQAGHAVTVDISGDKGAETLTLATKSKVSISGSSDMVTLSSSGTAVTISGSADNLTTAGTTTISITSPKSSDTISLGGNSTISLGKSDTLNLGTSKGAAVITASGSATVISSGAGTLKFTGAANAKDSIQAGSGSATLTAGKGASDKFIAGSGTGYLFTHAASGGGKDTFIGGTHNDTMVGAGTDKKHTDLFMFESSLKGGTHTITNFTTGKDTIDLVGYTKAQIDAAITAGAKTFNAKTGTETITLTDHTKITVSGLHSALGKSDFTGS